MVVGDAENKFIAFQFYHCPCFRLLINYLFVLMYNFSNMFFFFFSFISLKSSKVFFVGFFFEHFVIKELQIKNCIELFKKKKKKIIKKIKKNVALKIVELFDFFCCLCHTEYVIVPDTRCCWYYIAYICTLVEMFCCIVLLLLLLLYFCTLLYFTESRKWYTICVLCHEWKLRFFVSSFIFIYIFIFFVIIIFFYYFIYFIIIVFVFFLNFIVIYFKFWFFFLSQIVLSLRIYAAKYYCEKFEWKI